MVSTSPACLPGCCSLPSLYYTILLNATKISQRKQSSVQPILYSFGLFLLFWSVAAPGVEYCMSLAEQPETERRGTLVTIILAPHTPPPQTWPTDLAHAGLSGVYQVYTPRLPQHFIQLTQICCLAQGHFGCLAVKHSDPPTEFDAETNPLFYGVNKPHSVEPRITRHGISATMVGGKENFNRSAYTSFL